MCISEVKKKPTVFRVMVIIICILWYKNVNIVNVEMHDYYIPTKSTFGTRAILGTTVSIGLIQEADFCVKF